MKYAPFVKEILIKIRLKGMKGPARSVCSLCGLPAQKPAVKKKKAKGRKS